MMVQISSVLTDAACTVFSLPSSKNSLKLKILIPDGDSSCMTIADAKCAVVSCKTPIFIKSDTIATSQSTEVFFAVLCIERRRHAGGSNIVHL